MTAVRSRPNTFDVAIAGGGPVGLTLALALAQRSFDVGLVDAGLRVGAKPGAEPGGGRAFFVAFGCWRIWRALGLEPQLLRSAEPVASVEAQGQAGGISFLASDCKDEPVLGYMIEQGPLVAALTEAAKTSDRISLRPGRTSDARFADPRAILTFENLEGAGGKAAEIGASLIVGCDGARSGVRAAAGIRYEGWDYPARAISTTITSIEPHHGAARQIFLSSGPMAALPLSENRINLVWTERAAVAETLMALDDAGFEAELAKRADGFLSGVKLAGRRHAFPVGLHVADRFHGPRVALAGDSAHQIHPLAGQGLNLGLKDVAALVDVIAEAARVGLDIGAETALAPYTRWRRADVVASAAAMEGFARLFAGPAPVRIAAALAMQAAGGIPSARKLFAQEAGGVLGELPSLMRAG
jgi:2-octaprenyl-6-methoxyphenol hydroxylase